MGSTIGVRVFIPVARACCFDLSGLAGWRLCLAISAVGQRARAISRRCLSNKMNVPMQGSERLVRTTSA